MTIIIIDYGAGNIANVMKAIASTGLSAKLSHDPAEILSADGVVLPGVGAYGAAMSALNERQLIGPLQAYAKSGKPLLGVCLGMQLLFERSTEFGETAGLGIIPGDIVTLPQQQGYKVPQMGWNQNQVRQLNPITSTLNDTYTYFVHSFYVQTAPKYIAATVDYGQIEIPSVVVNDSGNVIGAQFHPEKSGKDGLPVWQSFKEMVDDK